MGDASDDPSFPRANPRGGAITEAREPFHATYDPARLGDSLVAAGRSVAHAAPEHLVLEAGGPPSR